jgi:hypothetical protein
MTKENVNSMLELRMWIETDISVIYKEWQKMKLEHLGYTWGYRKDRGTTQIIPVLSLTYNYEKVSVNANLGSAFEFPTRWLYSDWKDEALKGLGIEKSLEVERILSE